MTTRSHRASTSRRDEGRQGFSLVEVLLAIFILAIGIIAIAALFPAGIAQQRQSVDDVVGSIVANNAVSVLRSKLRPEDFGTLAVLPIEGDWPWRRPAFFKSLTIDGGITFPAGSISVFDDTLPNTTDSDDIPWNPQRYDFINFPNGPTIVITQGERYYPMFNRPSGLFQPPTPSPQYVWDCMFRRFQGKILVAIFVYRVAVTGGGGVPYTTPLNPFDLDVPAMPFHQVLDPADPDYQTETNQGVPGGMWDADPLLPIIQGTAIFTDYDRTNHFEAWQEPRQWILDQNNNVHRVLSRTQAPTTAGTDVELIRPVPEMPILTAPSVPSVYYFPSGPSGVADNDLNGYYDENVVSDIWYVPVEVMIDPNPNDGTSDGSLAATLTPIFVTVREL